MLLKLVCSLFFIVVLSLHSALGLAPQTQFAANPNPIIRQEEASLRAFLLNIIDPEGIFFSIEWDSLKNYIKRDDHFVSFLIVLNSLSPLEKYLVVNIIPDELWKEMLAWDLRLELPVDLRVSRLLSFVDTTRHQVPEMNRLLVIDSALGRYGRSPELVDPLREKFQIKWLDRVLNYALESDYLFLVAAFQWRQLELPMVVGSDAITKKQQQFNRHYLKVKGLAPAAISAWSKGEWAWCLESLGSRKSDTLSPFLRLDSHLALGQIKAIVDESLYQPLYWKELDFIDMIQRKRTEVEKLIRENQLYDQMSYQRSVLSWDHFLERILSAKLSSNTPIDWFLLSRYLEEGHKDHFLKWLTALEKDNPLAQKTIMHLLPPYVISLLRRHVRDYPDLEPIWNNILKGRPVLLGDRSYDVIWNELQPLGTLAHTLIIGLVDPARREECLALWNQKLKEAPSTYHQFVLISCGRLLGFESKVSVDPMVEELFRIKFSRNDKDRRSFFASLEENQISLQKMRKNSKNFSMECRQQMIDLLLFKIEIELLDLNLIDHDEIAGTPLDKDLNELKELCLDKEGPSGSQKLRQQILSMVVRRVVLVRLQHFYQKLVSHYPLNDIKEPLLDRKLFWY